MFHRQNIKNQNNQVKKLVPQEINMDISDDKIKEKQQTNQDNKTWHKPKQKLKAQK